MPATCGGRTLLTPCQTRRVERSMTEAPRGWGIRKREMTTVSEKIDAKLVKELREKSGAPMGDCLKALQETKGDIEDAFVVLRKRGMASAQKKAARTTNEGRGGHLHSRRRQDRRADRSELRERLCGPHRGLPGAAQGHRDAHRGQRSALREARGRDRRGSGAREGDLSARRLRPRASRRR